MMNCKDVSTLISEGDRGSWTVSRRLAVSFHLLICRHCRAFARQIEALAAMARRLSGATASEPPETLEASILDRLTRP